MAVTSYRADNAAVKYFGRTHVVATYQEFSGRGAEVWFRVTGSSIRFHQWSNMVRAMVVTIDGVATSVDSVAATDYTASIDLTTDAEHDITLKAHDNHSGGYFGLILADGIEVTGAAPAIAAHSATVGLEYEQLNSANFLAKGADTFAADYALLGYTTPSARQAKGSMRCGGNNAAIRRKATCSEVWTWGRQSQDNYGIGLLIDGVLWGTIPTLNALATTYQMIRFTGLDDSAEHEYEVVGWQWADGIGVIGSMSANAVAARTEVAWYGDSVTAADFYTSVSGGVKGHTAHVNFSIIPCARLGLTPLNRGLSGCKSFGDADGLVERRATDIDAFTPDIVVIHIGYNDATLIDEAAADDDAALNAPYTAAHVGLIDAILALSATTKVLYIQPTTLLSSGRRAKISSLQQAAIAACDDPTRVAWLSTNSLPADATIPANSVHPSPIGYCRLLGDSIGVLSLTDQPSAGDKFTVNGTDIIFDTHVTIGADRAATTKNLFAYCDTAGLAVSRINSGNDYAVAVVAATIAKTGTNLTAWTPEASGVIEALEGLLTQAPTVTTTAASSIGATSATAGGNVTSDGGATVTARGVCWSTTDSTPTLDSCDGFTEDGTGTGAFDSNMSPLPGGTLNYHNAYATNSVGTSYGTADDFTTLAGDPATGASISADGESLVLTYSREGGWPADMTVFSTAVCRISVDGIEYQAEVGGLAEVSGETLTVTMYLPIIVYQGQTVLVDSIEAGLAYSEDNSETIRTAAFTEGTIVTNDSGIVIGTYGQNGPDRDATSGAYGTHGNYLNRSRGSH